jgi:chromosome segregation ATPase
LNYVRTTEPIEIQLEKAQVLISQLNDNCREYREKITQLEDRLDACETKAQHFDIMIKAVQENAVVKGAWDKFMLSLRMTGYDKAS